MGVRLRTYVIKKRSESKEQGLEYLEWDLEVDALTL